MQTNGIQQQMDKNKTDPGQIQLHYGLTVGFAVFGFAWIGHQLDRRLGTGVLLTALLGLWGMASSFVWLWLKLRKTL